jgi:hypothetical protein
MRPEKKKYRPRNCTSLAASVMIQNYHHDRLEKYAEVREISLQKAVDIIIQLHMSGVNIARHMSETIGVKHEKYQDTLRKLGENHEYIR